MVILDHLKKEQISAMKEKDSLKVGAIRYLLSQVKNKEFELKAENRELTDEDVLRVIKKQIKQRNQSIEQYKQAGREESAEKEGKELELLQGYFDKFSAELGIEFPQRGPPPK